MKPRIASLCFHGLPWTLETFNEWNFGDKCMYIEYKVYPDPELPFFSLDSCLDNSNWMLKITRAPYHLNSSFLNFVFFQQQPPYLKKIKSVFLNE